VEEVRFGKVQDADVDDKGAAAYNGITQEFIQYWKKMPYRGLDKT
jgi:hypothetical protein